MQLARPTLRILSLATVCLIGAFGSSAYAEDHLTVELGSGRRFTAPVDSRTDAHHLWLRFEGRSAHLLRPIEWKAITFAEYHGKEIAVTTLPLLAQQIRTDVTLVQRLNTAAPAGQTHSQTARQLLFVSPVAALDLSVRVGNWDKDAQDDGLLLQLALVDSGGKLTSANVRLEVTLEATKTPHRDDQFHRVHHWATTASASDVLSKRPVKLAFPPQHEKWGSVGRVTVKAVIPGQGVYEKQTMVRLAPVGFGGA